MDEYLKKSLDYLPVVGEDVFKHIHANFADINSPDALVEIVELALITRTYPEARDWRDVAAVMGVDANKGIMYYCNPTSLVVRGNETKAGLTPQDVHHINVNDIKSYEVLKKFR